MHKLVITIIALSGLGLSTLGVAAPGGVGTFLRSGPLEEVSIVQVGPQETIIGDAKIAEFIEGQMDGKPAGLLVYEDRSLKAGTYKVPGTKSSFKVQAGGLVTTPDALRILDENAAANAQAASLSAFGH